MQSQHQYSCAEATAVTPVPHPLKLPDSAWSHKRCMQRRQRCSDLPSPVCPKNPQHLRAPSSCWHYHADLTRLAPIAHEGFGHKHGGAKKHITKAKPRAWLGQLPAHHPRAPRPSVGTPGRAETPGWGTSRPAGHGQSFQGFHRSRSRGDQWVPRGQGRTESLRVRTRGAPAGSCP